MSEYVKTEGKFSPLTTINPAYAQDDKNTDCSNYFHVLEVSQTRHSFDAPLVC